MSRQNHPYGSRDWGRPNASPSPSPYTPSPPPIISRRMSSPASRMPPPYIPCPRPMWPAGVQAPVPYRYPETPSPLQISMCSSPEYHYSSYPEYGVPLEPPEPIDGRSTADIIAAQSQDYVDEKLAEYQATIYQLQVYVSASTSVCRMPG
ncbi:lysine-rich arabinogalactan protein 19-like [Diaphorina citri]|uniref:Lysine-rich arabinogalactan protein 19-like n=1 Tax=Diaphorina citri TaxID=121845 RepID=A0A1S3DUW4_DIACI|nr:lysine-rich arabinogalactan protein 19-like [Diaphorina citri]